MYFFDDEDEDTDIVDSKVPELHSSEPGTQDEDMINKSFPDFESGQNVEHQTLDNDNLSNLPEINDSLSTILLKHEDSEETPGEQTNPLEASVSISRLISEDGSVQSPPTVSELYQQILAGINYTRSQRAKGLTPLVCNQIVIPVSSRKQSRELQLLRKAQDDGLAQLIFSGPDSECYEIGTPPMKHDPINHGVDPQYVVSNKASRKRAGRNVKVKRKAVSKKGAVSKKVVVPKVGQGTRETRRTGMKQNLRWSKDMQGVFEKVVSDEESDENGEMSGEESEDFDE
ncbi:hypothetical protein B0J11DRAFT_567084 [Dendryphion nanum]|uniref:Uncharacterized protein n=1 Tax=Dendryphion nanum TaxID=256645 RepID=A0A9P9E0L4_9PLEO|nr:hypothetical protein B0J11DRAFT_567084 [Dendryphion nanum]